MKAVPMPNALITAVPSRANAPFKMVNPNAVPVWPIDAMLPMEAICRSCPQRGFRCEGRM